MKLKSLEELKSVNLKGYCYYVAAWKMTRTSRHAYEPDLYIVLEDDGVDCVVAPYDNQKWTTTYPKNYVAGLIKGYPAMDSNLNNLVREVN